MPKKLTTEEFIEKARQVHGDKYDYSKTDLNNRDEKGKICIICPEHGEFWQKPHDHLRPRGCSKCGVIKRTNKRTIWKSKEIVFEESKKYEYFIDFYKHSAGAWVVAYKNGWLDEITWLKRTKNHPDGYWTKERVFEEAKKYSSRSEFQYGCRVVYKKAWKNKWLDEMTWLKSKPSKYLYSIYVYIDEENKIAYVGLTNDKIRRKSEHKSINKKHNPVSSYFHNIGKEVPEPIYLEENLKSTDAQIAEEFWKNEYICRGYYMLNKAPTGLNVSSLGGSKPKYSKKQIFEASKKCKKRSEFKKLNNTMYRYALKTKWIDEMIWLSKKQTHNNKTILCFTNKNQLIKEYKNTKEMKEDRLQINCVYRCCRNERKTYKGYIWKYKE